jgi:signal transduction histidine kinase
VSATESSSNRILWSYLRRTRQRLLTLAAEQPSHRGALAPVIEALATAESRLLEQDPSLPLRSARSARLASEAPPSPATGVLPARIEALEHAVRVREEQIAIVAHDLRSPLSPVLLLVRRLLDDLAEAPPEMAYPARTLWAKVDAISHRLEQFVGKLHRLLDATRLQTDDLVLDPEDIDLPVLVRDLVGEVTAELHVIPVIDVVGAKTLDGRWDRLRIEEILRNLMSNALRFGGGNPIKIEIKTGTDPELAVVAVRDHGVGIALADQARIFDKHVRVSRAPGGFGLGLWIVQELCRAMGGMVEVHSTPGEGAEFTVTLPRQPRAKPVTGRMAALGA